LVVERFVSIARRPLAAGLFCAIGLDTFGDGVEVKRPLQSELKQGETPRCYGLDFHACFLPDSYCLFEHETSYGGILFMKIS
jgi:hypothetical protein